MANLNPKSKSPILDGTEFCNVVADKVRESVYEEIYPKLYDAICEKVEQSIRDQGPFGNEDDLLALIEEIVFDTILYSEDIRTVIYESIVENIQVETNIKEVEVDLVRIK